MSGRLVLRGARLFDGGRLHDRGLLVEGSRVVALVGGDPPSDAEVVDLPGATVLPGLVDTHVHLAFDASPDPVATLAARSDDEATSAMVQAARTALAGGVTTVRDLGDRDHLSLPLRGRADLPTVVAAGPPITTPLGHCHFLGGATVDSVDGVRRAVRERAERGCDVVKVMSSGGTMTPGTRQEDAQFARDVLAAAVDEAHRQGLLLTAHAHGTAAIENCLAAGVDGMEHVSFWTADGVADRPDLRQAIADSGIAVGATVGMLPPPPGLAPPPGLLARVERFVANTRDMVECGAVVVAGTDAGIAPVKPHDVVRTAVAQLGELGMRPLEAFRTVTSVAAQVVGLGGSKGRLAAGYDADVLVVDGDPFTEPAAIHRIRAVYARGGWSRRRRRPGRGARELGDRRQDTPRPRSPRGGPAHCAGPPACGVPGRQVPARRRDRHERVARSDGSCRPDVTRVVARRPGPRAGAAGDRARTLTVRDHHDRGLA